MRRRQRYIIILRFPRPTQPSREHAIAAMAFVCTGICSFTPPGYSSTWTRSFECTTSPRPKRFSDAALKWKRPRFWRPSMVTEDVLERVATLKPPLAPTQRVYKSYQWRQHQINYFVAGPDDGENVLLIHGFGASINHWRRTIPPLLQTGKLKVWAVDLLGFGASDKPSPKSTTYDLDLWKELVIDFVNHFEPAKRWSLVGNSIGSLISLMVTAQLRESRVRSLCFMNSAGGLTSFRRQELNPVLGFLLGVFSAILFNPVVGSAIFRHVRKKETLMSILANVYANQEAVDDDLLDILGAPAFDEGACEVFLAVLNADAGPKPEELLTTVQWCPILVCWGEDDILTPFRTGMHPGIRFPEYHSQMAVHAIPNCGHCPHDDRPEEINKFLVPFLLHSENIEDFSVSPVMGES